MSEKPKRRRTFKKRPLKKYPPLTKEQKALCPFGTNRCRLCRLDPKDIEHLHYLRFEENMPYKDLIALIREDYGLGCSNTELGNHFNKHINTTAEKQGRLKKKHVTTGGALIDKKAAPIAEVLSPIVAKNVQIEQKLETAYDSMVRMTQDYVGLLDKIKQYVDATFSDKEKLEKQFKDYDPLKLLNAYTAFLKEHREQMKDINNLRAPKVVMVQFLEVSLKAIVEEMSNIFAMMCTGLQEGITHELRKEKADKIVSDQLFAPTFQRVAQEYQAKMTDIVREQLYQARNALAELSKIQ